MRPKILCVEVRGDHHAASTWKRISRDVGGHQHSRGYQKLQADLDRLLSEREPIPC